VNEIQNDKKSPNLTPATQTSSRHNSNTESGVV